MVRIVETWNTKLQELKETAQVPSSEGLIVGLDTSLLFRVLPDEAPHDPQDGGAELRDVLVVPYFRNAVRDVVSGYPVKNIYSEIGPQGDRGQDQGIPRGRTSRIAASGSKTCCCAT